jgi:uncharacterized protein YeeX (DUF496 family)
MRGEVIMYMTREAHSVEGWSPGNDERIRDLRADRLEALVNLAFLLRNDMNSHDKTEVYLDMMDRVLAGMTSDEILERTEIERRRYS